MPAVFETLESRQLFASVPPGAYEQYLIELVNRARNNPLLEAQRYGIDLNEGLNPGQITTTAKPPLAVNGFLQDSAGQHANYLRINGLVTLVGNGGSLPQDRMTTAGYAFTGTANGSAENVSAIVQTGPFGANLTADVDQIHRNMFVDAANNNRVNRVNMLTASLRELGAGLRVGPWNTAGGGGGGGGATQEALVAVEDFALSTGNASGDVFLTGVAYNDATTVDNFYTPGEGLGAITVTARNLSSGTTFTTTTFGSGGYALRLAPGTYDVIATGNYAGTTGSVRYPAVVIANQNVKRDFTAQQVGGTVPTPGSGGTTPPATNPVTLKGDLRGKVYFDSDGDGKRDDEEGGEVLENIRVYIDRNNNGVFDAPDQYGITQANGAYRITGLTAGIYTVRVDAPDGFRVSLPSNNEHTVKVNSSREAKVKSFALTDSSLISGTVYRDDNANGVFDPTIEKGRKDFRVYLDLNNDGVWQRETEPSKRTDKRGRYGFRDIAPGTYIVRTIPKNGYLQTQPGTGGYNVQLTAAGIGIGGINFGFRKLL